MKKENVVIDIAGLLLDVKDQDVFLQQPIYEAFIYKSKKKNGDRENRDRYYFSQKKKYGKIVSVPILHHP
jgi:hypothetical protein